MLKIKDLSVSISGKEKEKVLLKDFNLQVNPGEIHILMGPNGAGKSSFSKVLSGHFDYKVTNGDIIFENENISVLSPYKRALKGIFVSYQYPIEIPGISNFDFLYAAYLERMRYNGKKDISKDQFLDLILKKIKILDIKEEFLKRNINEGFSGGEKKKNEILQLLLFDPKIAILDEIDSGLDVDALRIITKALKNFSTKKNAIILITHYQKLITFLKPDYVHIIKDKKIIKTGSKKLASEIEHFGFEEIK